MLLFGSISHAHHNVVGCHCLLAPFARFFFLFFITQCVIHTHIHKCAVCTLASAIPLANIALKAASGFVESGPNQFIMFICLRKICKRIPVYHVLALLVFRLRSDILTRIKENINFPWILFLFYSLTTLPHILSLYLCYSRSFCSFHCQHLVYQFNPLWILFLSEIRKYLFECGLMQTHTLSIQR